MWKNLLFALSLVLLSSAIRAQTLVDIATDATDPFNLDDSEPSIAVNPLNPLQIAVVSFSGGWSAMANERGPIWMSTDGGATWTKNNVITAPTAASFGSGDQKLAWGNDGNLYVVELALGEGPPNCFIYRPSGGNWVAGAAFGDDQPMLDRTGATLLSAWLNFGVAPERSTMERTPDNGVTVAQTAIGSAAFPNRTTRTAVAPGGAAYALYKTRQGGAGNFETATFRVVRSTDGGVTWNSPGVPVHPGTVQTWFTSAWGNAQNGGMVGRARSSDGWIAVNPVTGNVWAVFCNRDASTFGQIYAVRSTDGGNTWGVPVRVSDGTLNSAYPEIAVAATGAVGVLYIDYDDSGPQTVYTHRFARSFDDGATWERTNLQSLRTQELANGAPGFLWGDYEGLTAVGNQFYGVFTGRSIGRAVVQLDPIFFTMSAAGPGIQVPSPPSFAASCTGEVRTATLNVCNTGTTNLVVTAIASSNPEFAIVAPSAGLPVTISHDFCFPFQVTFTPTVPGTRTTDITIQSSDPGSPTLHVAASADVGQATIVTAVAGSGDFGEVCPGRFRDGIITVINSGTCPLKISNVTSSSPELRVPQVLAFPIHVAPGANIELPIRFEPATAGAKTAIITLTSNDPAAPAKVVSLSAFVPPPHVCSPLALASIEAALGPTFGSGTTGSYTVSANGQVLRAFGLDGRFAAQAQGEAMYYPRRREGQLDLGILYRRGAWQAGLAGSVKTASLRAEEGPGSLSQASVSVDRLMPAIRVGAFVSKGLGDRDVVGTTPTIERVMQVVDTFGVDAQFSILPPLWWLDANIASLKRYAPGASNTFGGAVRVSRQFQPWLVGMAQVDVNESFVSANTVGTVTIGITLGHRSRPTDFANPANPLGTLIPRVHYEVYDRVP